MSTGYVIMDTDYLSYIRDFSNLSFFLDQFCQKLSVLLIFKNVYLFCFTDFYLFLYRIYFCSLLFTSSWFEFVFSRFLRWIIDFRPFIFLICGLSYTFPSNYALAAFYKFQNFHFHSIQNVFSVISFVMILWKCVVLIFKYFRIFPDVSVNNF